MAMCTTTFSSAAEIDDTNKNILYRLFRGVIVITTVLCDLQAPVGIKALFTICLGADGDSSSNITPCRRETHPFSQPQYQPTG